jgi:hypothetical protein
MRFVVTRVSVSREGIPVETIPLEAVESLEGVAGVCADDSAAPHASIVASAMETCREIERREVEVVMTTLLGSQQYPHFECRAGIRPFANPREP